MASRLAKPHEVAEIIAKIEALGAKVSNYTVEAKQDGVHLHVSVVLPWIDVEAK